MLHIGQAKHLASTTTAAKTMSIATQHDRRPATASEYRRSAGGNKQKAVSIDLGRSKTKPEFFKTNNQHAFDQLQVGSNFNKNKVQEFCFTRYKQKANSNYDAVPVASRNQAIDGRQPHFQMRITHNNGEPDIPISASTVYKPVEDKKRFVKVY